MKLTRNSKCQGGPFSLGQSHASAYHRSLVVSSTTISYSVYVVVLGVCLRFKPHWMFQIYKYVIEGREELTSCSSLIQSHMFPLLDVLYRQVGNLSLGSDVNTMTSAWDSELLSIIPTEASKLCSRQLSTPGQGLSDWPVLRRATFKVSGYLK